MMQKPRKNASCKKLTGQKRRGSARRLKMLSDASFEAIFLSEKGICIDQNLTAEKLFSYTLREAVGRHGSEWVIPEDRELVRKNMLSDYAAPYEVTALRKNGTTFPCEIQARSLCVNGRRLRITALRDITERKQAEKDMLNLQAKLANAIEMAHLGHWEYDVIEDSFIFNDSFYKMFRTTVEHVGGYTMPSAEYARRFVHPDDIDVVAEEVRKAIETTDPHYTRQLEHRILYGDGAVGYISVRFFIQKDAGGATVRTLGVNQDITDRKQAEEVLRKLNEKLAQRTELAENRSRQLQSLAVELIEAEERERQRIAELLHDDLQQMLAAAKMQLQSVSDNSPIEQPMLTHIGQILEQSIAKSRRLSHELSPPVLHQSGLIAGLQWLNRRIGEQFGLKVDLEASEKKHFNNALLNMFLYRAVQELLFNIVKHAGVQKARTILTSSENRLFITVVDQGRGFDPEILDSVTKTPGLGLLSLRERARYIGGDLLIESAPGKGSRFTLAVPFNLVSPVARPVAPAIVWPSPAKDSQMVPTKSATRVILADDHKVMRQGLMQLIAKHPDIQVVGEASNGREALVQSRQLQPDVVVMDVSMPEMDGIEATRRIKAELPAVRVIGLSMFDDEHIVASMQKAGAASFVMKTASSVELMQAICGHGPEDDRGTTV